MYKYLAHYPPHLQAQFKTLFEEAKSAYYLRTKYPQKHTFQTDKNLYGYVQAFKVEHFKKEVLSRVSYDGKVAELSQALGLHTFAVRKQGNKVKVKNEIRIATLFKNVPEEFLRMIVVHELAHFKEKEHNKAFYRLCTHIEPSYHQLELDVRIYLTHLELVGEVY